VQERAATVVVETDAPVAMRLSFPQSGRRWTSEMGTSHRFVLDELEPATAYDVEVVADGITTERVRFRTAPDARAVLRIAAYGDVRGGHVTHAALVEAMRAEAPDLVLATGDLVLRGSDDGDWQRFFAVTRPLLSSVPYYPAIGNHDLGRATGSGRFATEQFALPPPPPDRPAGGNWYSFDVAGVHFVALDSNAYELPEQLTWLDADLVVATARAPRAIVAFTHDGPYSRGSHGGNDLAARLYAPILAKHKVDLLLSGHDHLYQRGRVDGLDYVVTGGGGASLYPIVCGVAGKRRCTVRDGMRAVFREHHFLMITIEQRTMMLCARRADGSLLERCARIALRAAT
jgi:3',5'-cyclic AMP phosphodiesterase CpdA